MAPIVLLTGATGYIGGRLLPELEKRGRRVRCLARDPGRLDGRTGPETEVVQGDCLDRSSLDAAFAGVEHAFYLVHSMNARRDFTAADREAALNFGRAAARAGVRRIVYLGGLAHANQPLSEHLSSRNETGDILRASGVPVVELRASIIVGAGSLSFEMIRALVERLPVMICPRWIRTPTQPIGVADVLEYLVTALELEDGASVVYEIGGPDVVSYGDLMREYARQRGLRRYLVPVPVLTPHLSGLWLALVTPAHARVGRALVEGLRNATAVRSNAALAAFPVRPRPLRDAIAEAIDDPLRTDRFVDTQTRTVAAPPSAVFHAISRIGGANGWYFGNVLWRWRGWLDRLAGGVGMSRGRACPDRCMPGDIIDCWRIARVEPGRLLELAAEMRLPGRGRLAFDVETLPDGRTRVRQTASFDPTGVLGRLYWYLLYPVHAVMFRGMLDGIVRYASSLPANERASALGH